MKQCSHCKESKPILEFRKNKTLKDGIHNACKSCQRGFSNKWKRNHPERHKKYIGSHPDFLKSWRSRNKSKQDAINFRSLLKNKYGITPQDYESMFIQQNGACFICKGQNLNGQRLAVDHDHKTNKVRGLLCHSCNRLLGSAKDSIPILYAAADYLERNLSCLIGGIR